MNRFQIFLSVAGLVCVQGILTNSQAVYSKDAYTVVFDNKLSWHDAQAACIKLSVGPSVVSLAAPKTPEELDEIREFLNEATVQRKIQKYWIGGIKRKGEIFHWFDGGDVDNFIWDKGQPTNSKSGWASRCTELWYDGKVDMVAARDVLCSEKMSFVCKATVYEDSEDTTQMVETSTEFFEETTSWDNFTDYPFENSTDSPFGNFTDSPFDNFTDSPFGNFTDSPFSNFTDSFSNFTDNSFGNFSNIPIVTLNDTTFGNFSQFGNFSDNSFGNYSGFPFGNFSDNSFSNFSNIPIFTFNDTNFGNFWNNSFGNFSKVPIFTMNDTMFGNFSNLPSDNFTSPFGNFTDSSNGTQTKPQWSNLIDSFFDKIHSFFNKTSSWGWSG